VSPSHSIGDAADRVEEQLDELGVGSAHFAGNSMGGALALELAKRGRARSVVAISPGGGWRPEDAAEGERIIKWFARNQKLARLSLPRAELIMRRPGTRRLVLRDVMVHGELVPPKEAVGLVRGSVNCTVVEDVFATIRSGSALLTDLDKIECPVLVAWGDKDRILPLPRHGPRFRDEIPGVEFRVWKGVGHTPMWDDPGLVASTIGDFAAAADARRGASTPVSAA
jgi:pimeloyl-ACP methyl ester carboxylesterase